MRNFSGIVAWYSADRIRGMLAWSSNISIIFIVNSRIALYFETEMLNGEEKSLRHVAMVATFLDDNKPKIHLKSKLALFQTSSTLFNFIWFVKCWRNFLDLIRKDKKTKKKLCVVFTQSIKRAREIKKFHVAGVQRRLRNVQKKRDARESCCFANLNLWRFFLMQFSLRSPSSLLILGPIVVIQKSGYRGSWKSHFSSLLNCEWRIDAESR